MFRKILIAMSILVVFSASAQTQISRYMTVSNAVAASQLNPLLQTFQINFPASIGTVGDAVNFILINTGYKLVPAHYQSNTIQQLLNKPLPLSVRSIGPTTVENGLLALSGGAFQLVVDPAHRLITYRLRPQYQAIYHNNHGDF